MKYKVDKNQHPVYLQIYNQIKEDIISGIIPYGSRMFIVSNDGVYIYGVAVAEDCGGAIKGDRIDLYLPTYEECVEFGRRTCTIYFLG